MYGFRKPFTAAAFDEDPFAPGHKAVLVLAQILGYTLSKFVGIRWVPAVPAHRRVRTLLGLIFVAELAWLGFGMVPAKLGFLFLFLNGLPLGMVFGLVLSFLEGRQQTEAFIAGLCASFIVADGLTKSVGAQLLEWGVSESWMPAVAGGVFLLPLMGFVWMLQQTPPPTAEEERNRVRRVPMDAAAQRSWLRRHAGTLTWITLGYLLLTVLRSLRADFAPEIWRDLGVVGRPAVFAQSELMVAFAVLVVNACVVCIREHRRAFQTSVGISMAGLLLVLLVLALREGGWLTPMIYMVLVGFGLYLPYVAVHTTLFERWLALSREPGTIRFPMYVVDAVGYLGYVAVLMSSRWVSVEGNHLPVFQWVSCLGAGLALICFWRVSARMR